MSVQLHKRVAAEQAGLVAPASLVSKMAGGQRGCAQLVADIVRRPDGDCVVLRPSVERAVGEGIQPPGCGLSPPPSGRCVGTLDDGADRLGAARLHLSDAYRRNEPFRGRLCVACDTRTISIAVLGPLAIDGFSRRIKRAATYELLAYLALHPKGASRDELVEAIWPAQDPERTRPRFWQSVTEARKAIGDAWLHEGERYQLDRSKVRVDLDELDQLLTVASDDTTSDATTLERALVLWRGEPLEGTDYLWAEGEMRSLSATLLDLLERVGRVRLAHGDARGALQMAEQAIALDQLHEPSWRLALQAEHALGLRESITRRYDDLTRSLDEQLGLEPARETRLVYRQLLGQS